MKRTLCILLACVILLSGCAAGNREWQEQYNLGMRYLEDGDYEEAILAFSAAIKIDSSRPEAYMGRAEAYIAIGEHEKAVKDYKKAKKAAKADDDYEELLEELEELIEELEEFIEEQTQETPEAAQAYISTVEFYLDGDLQCSYQLKYTDGWLLSEVWTLDPNGDLMDCRFYAYDEQGRLQSVESDAGFCAEYVYDDKGRLSEILSDQGETYFVYDETGKQILSCITSDFCIAETVYTYDEQGRVAYEETHQVYSDAGIDDVTFYECRYDSQGRLKEKSGNYETIEYDYYANVRVDNYVTLDNVFVIDTAGECCWMLPVSFAITSVKTNDGLLERINGENITCLFTYITAEEMPAEKPKQELSKQPEYEIIREDRSIYDDGILRVEHYYDRVVLLGDSPELASINAYIEADMENFLDSFSGYDMESELSYLEGTDYCYYSTAKAEVTSNSGGVFSLRISTFWFWGGVGNSNYYGLSYDTRTGEPVDLASLFGMSEEALTQELKDRAWEYLTANCADSLWDASQEALYSYNYEDFLYYFQDGQLILTFPTYSLSYGAAGSFTVPTGLYH